MNRKTAVVAFVAIVAALGVIRILILPSSDVAAQGPTSGGRRLPYATFTKPGVPMFEVDPAWPKMPENNWILGEIPNVAVDPQDHVWILQRQGTLQPGDTLAGRNPPKMDCCAPAPPVMEFDAAGHFIQGWGGPGPGYEWPEHEHGIHIDYRGNVWLTGGGEGTIDHQILKFTKAGKFLLQIGHSGRSNGASGVAAIVGSKQLKNFPADFDTENLNQATDMVVWPKTNELFVSDGYVNRRVIVFDADTGAFKRLWGAYGAKPDDSAPRDRVLEGPPPRQFNTVHDVTISNDEFVYVVDRSNYRIQVFHLDGTYVMEGFIDRKNSPTVDDIAFSPDPDQKFLYVVASPHENVWILERKTLQIVGKFGRRGPNPGQWLNVHGIATDSKGNIYTVGRDRRLQKFVFKGFSR